MEDLNEEQIAMLRKAFDGFDREGEGHIKVDMVGSILRMMGQTYNAQTLRDLMTEFDPEGKGTLEFEVFAALAARFMDDDTDDAELAKELKEAFRLYDKEGNGFIPTSSLNEILKELDDTLSDEDRKNIIDEVDADGSGTLDFDEFMEMMTG